MIGGPGFTIGLCSAERLRRQMDSFVALLQDAVEDGASVGYLPPLSGADAQEYWETVCAAIAGGARRLIAAEEGEGVLGAVQLDLPAMPNARHRGEVMKLIVRRLARRRGVGRALMQALEQTAAALNRTLLVLERRCVRRCRVDRRAGRFRRKCRSGRDAIDEEDAAVRRGRALPRHLTVSSEDADRELPVLRCFA